MSVSVGDVLVEFRERLGANPEPEVLTLTERNGFVPQSTRFNKGLATESTAKYKRISLGDLAFNPYLLWAGAIAVACNDAWEDAVISPLYPTFRVRPGYDWRYIARLLLTPEMIRRYDTIAFGSVPRRRRSSVENFLALSLPTVPSLEEQRRIADILDRADALRAKRRETIAHLDTLTQSIFHDMFGDPVRNTKRLETRRLDEVGRVTTGNSPSRSRQEYFDVGIEWIKSDNINGAGTYLTSAAEHLSLEGEKVARVVEPGAVLVTCIAGSPGAIGNAAVADRRVAFNQQINSFEPHDCQTLFWYFQLRAAKKLVQNASTGGMKGLVSKSRFGAIVLPDPSTGEKGVFVKRVKAASLVQEPQSASLGELDALFASVQERAFLGQL